MNPTQRLLLKRIVAHGFLLLSLALVITPFLMVVIASLRKGNLPPNSLWLDPGQWSLEHWKYVLNIPFPELVNPSTGETRIIQPPTPPLNWLLNSVIVSAFSSAGIILLSGTAAYAFARMQFKFRGQLLRSLLILQMFPAILALTAYYAILDSLGRQIEWLGLNTLAGLIMIYLAGVSTNIWMIKGYFETIPASMEESARIDGATPFQTFVRILLPISTPIFAVVFILSFIYTMSEYPVASAVLGTPQHWTLAVGASSLLREHEKMWGHFAALAVLSGVPITVMFLLCQRFVIGGLTSGGIRE
jgi:maltose/maltodextrin transport system permease protein